MTVEQFNEKHGKEWNEFRRTPMFACLRAVIAANSPAKLNFKRSPADVMAGGALFFAENQGYEQAVELLEEKLGLPIGPPVVHQSDYAEPEV